VGVRIPIACTLTTADAESRVDEWRDFLASSTTTSERLSGHQLRVQLAPAPGVLEAAVDLAQREKTCCAFFDFAIDVATDQLWLRVAVPPEASGILDDFASLLAPSP
jgi:hypothetical protein